MHLNIPHTFSKAEARSRVEHMLREAKTQHPDKATIEEECWEGDALHFAVSAQGQRVSGQAEIQDNAFVIDATLPLMMRMFEGRLEKMIAEQAKQVLK